GRREMHSALTFRIRTGTDPMANHNEFRDRPELMADDIDYVLGYANPNSTRIGCPPRDVLIALALGEGRINDPTYEHLATCSPCYREFRALQSNCVTSRHRPEPTRRR